MVPTPARASREATADPVAPQPTTTTRAAARRFCPSAPTPRNRICREYRSSSSKDITNLKPRNLYYKSRRRDLRLEPGLFDGAARIQTRQHCFPPVHRTSEPATRSRSVFASKGKPVHHAGRVGTLARQGAADAPPTTAAGAADRAPNRQSRCRQSPRSESADPQPRLRRYFFLPRTACPRHSFLGRRRARKRSPAPARAPETRPAPEP